jgi:hypothetical protein
MTKLDYNESFEWQGAFWFPQKGAEPRRYSGKISYTPQEGIRLSLFDLPSDAQNFKLRDQIAKHTMHGIIQDGSSARIITLLKVHLNCGGIISSFYASRMEGSAQALIMGVHCDAKDIKSIAVEYNNVLQSLFFWDAHSETYSYAKESSPIKLQEGESIKLDYGSTGRFLSHNNVDDVFFSFEKKEFDKFKKEFSPLFEKYKKILLSRNDIVPEIVFKNTSGGIDSLIRLERVWNLFWSLLTEDSIQIIGSYACKKTKNGTEKHPLLARNFIGKKARTSSPHLKWWKITRYSFGDKSGDWIQMSPSIEKWLEINASAEWQPIMHVIKKIVEDGVATPSDYLALVAASETFLDLKGETTAKTEVLLDKLVAEYSTPEWSKEFEGIAGTQPAQTGYGEWFAGVRHVITHPKSRKAKDKKKYYQLAYDEIELHKAYAGLSSIFVKAVLTHIGNIDAQAIDEYIMRFLKNNASVHYVDWQN